MAVAGLVLGYVFVIPWAILFSMDFAGAIAGSPSTPQG
jgi:Sec-independent protein secretion pathway component TatC